VIRGHARLARYGAPAAFLLAVTIAVLLVRSGLSNGGGSTPPEPATTAATSSTAEPPAGTGTTTTPTSGAEFYKIQSGDTLAVIADRYDTTVEQLLVLNPDLDPVALTVGERIRVK
jgi:LysM repeat protein